jgi:hypothetical protein
MGCLKDKTQEQKEVFFYCLLSFSTKDNEFFEEQFLDLEHEEKVEFLNWLSDTAQKAIKVLEAINILTHKPQKTETNEQ